MKLKVHLKQQKKYSFIKGFLFLFCIQVNKITLHKPIETEFNSKENKERKKTNKNKNKKIEQKQEQHQKLATYKCYTKNFFHRKTVKTATLRLY